LPKMLVLNWLNLIESVGFTFGFIGFIF
jgi:hypothetical protein